MAVETTLAEALASAIESVTNANAVIDFAETMTAVTLAIVENKTVSMTLAAETLADTEAVSVTYEAVIKIVAVETVANNLRAKAAAVATAVATANTALAEAVAAVAEADAVAVTDEAVAVAANDSLLLCDTDLLVLNTMAAESGVTADLVGTLVEGLLVAETLAAKAEAATVETVAVAEAVAVTVTVAVAVTVTVIEAETIMAVSVVMVLDSAGDSSERSDEVSANHFNERGNVKIFCCFFLASQCF